VERGRGTATFVVSATVSCVVPESVKLLSSEVSRAIVIVSSMPDLLVDCLEL